VKNGLMQRPLATAVLHESDGRGDRWIPLVHFAGGQPHLFARLYPKSGGGRFLSLAGRQPVSEDGKTLCGYDLGYV
jgi:hypothetical protein